jgi:hypothetical protein
LIALALTACSEDEKSGAAVPSGTGATGGTVGDGAAATGGSATDDSGAAGSLVDGAGSDGSDYSATSSPGGSGGSGGSPRTDSGREPGPDAACGASEVCRNLCESLADGTDCGLNDSDVELCRCQCESDLQPLCTEEIEAFVSCAGNSVVCVDGFPAASGCDSESQALDVCTERAANRLCAEEIPACRDFCDAAVASHCDAGPVALSDCLCGCEDKLAGGCPTEWDALALCAGTSFETSCDQSGEVLVQGSCSAEWAALALCL